jgi:S1-C subfamily serine protease
MWVMRLAVRRTGQPERRKIFLIVIVNLLLIWGSAFKHPKSSFWDKNLWLSLYMELIQNSSKKIGVLLLAAVGAGGYFLGARTGTTASSAPLRTVNISAAASTNGINVEAIVQRVEPAVVDILTKGGVSGTSSAFEAAGTGMIITPSGEVVTNNHVVVDATTIRVRIYGQKTLHRARVVGVDPSKDIAVIQIEGVSHLPTVTFGNSAQVKVGTPVVAIGNALDLSGAPTVTEGIVSALGRSITASDSLLPGGSEHLTGLIQTDAPINPGNSGGPLVDSSGQVIGMNTAVLASAGSTPTSGIGFAIPSDRIVRIADEIRAGHKGNGIELGAPALLGVVVENDNPAIQAEYSLGTAHGALVLQVLAGSGAAHAGLRPGDVITGVDGHSVKNATELKDLIVAHKPGTSITVQWVTTSGQTEHASALLMAGPVA